MHLVTFDWAGYRTLLAYAYGVLLIFWLIAELLVWRVNQMIHRRIDRIAAVLQTVEKNGFTDRVPLDGGPEFALLGREINAMITRIDLSHRYFADLHGFVAHNLRACPQISQMKAAAR